MLYLAYVVILASLLLLGFLVLLFYLEKEKKALWQVLKPTIVLLLLTVFFVILKVNLLWLSMPLLFLGLVLLLLLIVPYSVPKVHLKLNAERYDERLTIFSRMYELRPGDAKYQSFYEEHPQLKAVDDQLRAQPGLLSPDSKFYNRKVFQQAKKYVRELEEYFPLIKGNPIQTEQQMPPPDIENMISKQGKALGAADVGFTKLEAYHLYGIKGRGTAYGRHINNHHQFAVAITVEMNKDAVDQAPYAPVIEESTKQYLKAAKVATGLAEYIRTLGYEATAHIDANYEVICPLVARDAGLGQIGRMGILMTPSLGPRVRLAVVSTQLPLKPSKSKALNSVHYFCSICKKCAVACPSQAIQHHQFDYSKQVRYQISQEKCYGYWALAGTDCARCMSVCPYSHPNTFFHKLVRFGINQNPIFARLALWADHYFYGRIPKSKGHLQTS